MKFHHLGLTVPDLDAALNWYKNVLGFEKTAEILSEGSKLKIALIQNGDTILEVFEMPDSKRLEPKYEDVKSHLPFEGWRHLAFVVDDLESSHRASVAAGGIHVQDPVKNTALGYTYSFIRDPFGNLIEFVETF